MTASLQQFIDRYWESASTTLHLVEAPDITVTLVEPVKDARA